MSGIISPNTRNLVVGKGFALFKPDYLDDYFHLGRIPKLVYKPDVKQLDHFSEMEGTKVLDFSVILQKGGMLTVDMEERTANNLALFFLADIDSTDPDAVTLDIFSKSQAITGAFKFYATNDVGPRWHITLNKVIINPNSNFEPISDNWGAFAIEAKHVIDDDGLWGKMILQPDISTIAPVNVLLPFIDGPQLLGDVPAAAFVGEVMTANIGAWIGASTGIAFQWYNSSGIIVGATKKTYVPVTGDIGKTLHVIVTASNPVGDTSATSGVTLPVHS